MKLFCNLTVFQFYFKAKHRISTLEKAVTKAQTSETKIIELQQWLYRVDDMLNDFIENDTTVQVSRQVWVIL